MRVHWPFLLLHHINVGLALLVYSPFAQRALALMGAGSGAPRPAVVAQ